MRGVRRVIKDLKTKNFHTSEGIDLIIRGIEKLAVKKDILKYTNNKLIETLIEKKKTQTRQTDKLSIL